MVSASLTPASVHGVSRPRPASILLPTSQNTPMESAGTGTTGKNRTFLLLHSYADLLFSDNVHVFFVSENLTISL